MKRPRRALPSSANMAVVLALTRENVRSVDALDALAREECSRSDAVARVEAELAACGSRAPGTAHALPPDVGFGQASAARWEQVHALERQYSRLAALPAAEAAAFLVGRPEASAATLQRAWRRQSARRSLRATVQRVALARRHSAATRIQRAARLARRLRSADSGSASLPGEALSILRSEIGARSIAMAEELRVASAAVAEAAGLAEGELKGEGAVRSEDMGGKDVGRQGWPAWHSAPAWLSEAEAPGGSALVREIRATAAAAQRFGRQQQPLVSALEEWGGQRRALQRKATRRQVSVSLVLPLRCA